MPRRIGISVQPPRSREERGEVIGKVKVAEEVGVAAAFTAERWGRDQFTFLTELALETQRIGLGTGIAPVYGRSPAVLAMTIASLDELSGGRMTLGLGGSGARVVEHWHGEPFARPLQRLREYVEVIRLILSGERVVYEGEIFKLDLGFRFEIERVREHIPIYLASLAPRAVAQTGEQADGWMPYYWPASRYGEGLALLAQGAQEAGRAREEIAFAPAIAMTIGDDAVSARAQAREALSFYIGRMGTFYAQMLSRNGYATEVEACRAGWAQRDATAAGAAIPERMLDDTTLAGTLDDVRQGLDTLFERGVDLPILTLPPGSLEETERVLGTLVQG